METVHMPEAQIKDYTLTSTKKPLSETDIKNLSDLFSILIKIDRRVKGKSDEKVNLRNRNHPS